MDKIKVVWICHFSNQQIRAKIPLSKRYFANFLRRLLSKRSANYFDFAPWVTNLIREFEKLGNVELHIIAPHDGLTRLTYEFEMNGISYHVFKPSGKSILSRFSKKILKENNPQYKTNRKIVKQFIKTIQPDIVNLFGTENPYYSITTLDVKKIPVYVSAQTVYTNPDRLKYSGAVDKHRWDIELKIHQKELYYGCGGRMHRDLILNNNPEAVIFKSFFPIQKPSNIEKDVEKIFDFVFFAAQVTNKKGIEDALEALALVKKQYGNVTLNVVGKCAPDYKIHLLNIMQKTGIEDSVSFNDYFPLITDMHEHIKNARFALLPLKLDVISSALIEAIYLGLPVVTYRTSGTPYLNKDGETVLLADIGDTEKLAENMLKLLNTPALAEKLKRDAKVFVEREFDNKASAKRLVSNYKAVINHYHQNIPIPEKQLFNTDEFPLY